MGMCSRENGCVCVCGRERERERETYIQIHKIVQHSWKDRQAVLAPAGFLL